MGFWRDLFGSKQARPPKRPFSGFRPYTPRQKEPWQYLEILTGLAMEVQEGTARVATAVVGFNNWRQLESILQQKDAILPNALTVNTGPEIAQRNSLGVTRGSSLSTCSTAPR